MPGQDGFKYVYTVGHIDDVLTKIRETGRPDKLTFPYTQKTWLLKNAQYSAVLDLLKDMDFIDSSGSPTTLYGEYQNRAMAGHALAKGIRKAYASLFKAYPNAHSLSKENLEGYIKQHTGADSALLVKISGTFRRLCSFADFSDGQEMNQNGAESNRRSRPQSLDTPHIPIRINQRSKLL